MKVCEKNLSKISARNTPRIWGKSTWTERPWRIYIQEKLREARKNCGKKSREELRKKSLKKSEWNPRKIRTKKTQKKKEFKKINKFGNIVRSVPKSIAIVWNPWDFRKQVVEKNQGNPWSNFGNNLCNHFRSNTWKFSGGYPWMNFRKKSGRVSEKQCLEKFSKKNARKVNGRILKTLAGVAVGILGRKL